MSWFHKLLLYQVKNSYILAPSGVPDTGPETNGSLSRARAGL